MENSKKSITQKIISFFKSWHLSPQGSRPDTRDFNNTIGNSPNGKIKMHWHTGYKLPVLFFKPKQYPFTYQGSQHPPVIIESYDFREFYPQELFENVQFIYDEKGLVKMIRESDPDFNHDSKIVNPFKVKLGSS